MEKQSTRLPVPNSNKFKILPKDFFLQDAVTCAKLLLGKGLYICRNGREQLAQIVETEAYLGKSDPASHSFRGLTPRSAPMFEAGGIAYVYFIYGMYYCFNVVTGKKGVGEAVLIRAARPLSGFDFPSPQNYLFGLKGPGKLARAFSIDFKDNRRDLCDPNFCLVDFGIGELEDVLATSRIGVMEERPLKLRFYPSHSKWPSNV